MAVRKRDHLLAVAQRMFCEIGFHAVSVDAILEEAGVARMTLYKNFGSKEDLIVATLKREDTMFRQWLASAVEARSNHPKERILGLFHALHDRFASNGYYGCAFIRASIEYPASSHPVHRAARDHKEMIRSYLRGLAAEVEATYEAVQMTRDQIQTFQDELLKQSEESRTITLAAYEEGGTELLPVLDAQRTRSEVRQQYFKTLFDYQASLIDLELAAGKEIRR